MNPVSKFIKDQEEYLDKGPCNICLVQAACKNNCRRKIKFNEVNGRIFIIIISLSAILYLANLYSLILFPIPLGITNIANIIFWLIFANYGLETKVGNILAILLISGILTIALIIRQTVVRVYYQKIQFYKE